MGLFSKKTYICEKCGKEFQKRINLNGNFCDECFAKEMKEKEELEGYICGYVDYGLNVLAKEYSIDELREIAKRKENRVNFFRNKVEITKEELIEASENYKNLSDDYATMILAKAIDSTVNLTAGAVFKNCFFCPTTYFGTIVDARDVFAVGYISDYKMSSGDCDAILCAVFTDDPYIPVFPMVFYSEKKFFEFAKSKKGREYIENLFNDMCPCLTYPVCELKQLKKIIKEEGKVRGNIDIKFMLNRISDATYSSGMFNTKKTIEEICFSPTTKMLNDMGYFLEGEVDTILHMDKRANNKFWNKLLER